MESPAVLRPCRRLKLAWQEVSKTKSTSMPQKAKTVLAVIDLRIIPDLVL
jgi:hypothetical protein